VDTITRNRFPASAFFFRGSAQLAALSPAQLDGLIDRSMA
jgi:hypothetical protein